MEFVDRTAEARAGAKKLVPIRYRNDNLSLNSLINRKNYATYWSSGGYQAANFTPDSLSWPVDHCMT